MTAAIFTAILFAFSAITGQRVAVRYGAIMGNWLRLSLAVLIFIVIIGVWQRDTLHQAPFAWLFLSGLVGFGVGDVALFTAYEKLGSRLTILIALCSAPVFGMITEALWLNVLPSAVDLALAALILTGVALALRSRVERGLDTPTSRAQLVGGTVAAAIAGWGQGTGAVISRKAEEVALEVGVGLTGFSAAGQRVMAGWVFACGAMLIWRLASRGKNRHVVARGEVNFTEEVKFFPILLGAATLGPVVGVSCFQWALQSTPSGLVLAVTATTPIILMPLTWGIDGDRPRLLAWLGAIAAVLGVTLLALR